MVEVRSQQDEIADIVATVAADQDHEADPAELNGLGLLKYRAANDNSERAWTRWLWLGLALSVPIAFVVGLIRIALG